MVNHAFFPAKNGNFTAYPSSVSGGTLRFQAPWYRFSMIQQSLADSGWVGHYREHGLEIPTGAETRVYMGCWEGRSRPSRFLNSWYSSCRVHNQSLSLLAGSTYFHHVLACFMMVHHVPSCFTVVHHVPSTNFKTQLLKLMHGSIYQLK